MIGYTRRCMHRKENNSGSISSVAKTLRIVDALQKNRGATVTELAGQLDLAKSTVHNHLATLKKHDYVIQRNRKYHLSLKFLDLGTWVKSTRQISSAAHPVLKRLAEKTKLAAWLIVEENGFAVGLEREIGEEFEISAPRPGERSYMHNEAGGKAILAHLPKSRVNEILEKHGLPAATDQTITDREDLFEELEKIHERGFAFDWDEAIEGFGSVSAPIIVENSIHGALSIAGPKTRIIENWEKDEIANLVLSGKNEVELNLMYPQQETQTRF